MAERVTRDWRRRKTSSTSTTRIEHRIPPELVEWVQVTTEQITALQHKVFELEQSRDEIKAAHERLKSSFADGLAAFISARAA